MKLISANWKLYLLGGISIALSMWLVGYVLLWNSSEYAFAKDIAYFDSKIIDEIGKVNSDRPGIANFKRNFSNEVWSSRFSIVLNGSKSSGILHLKLKSSENKWIIEESILELANGTSLNLSL